MAVPATRADCSGGEPPGGPGRVPGAQPGDTVVIDGAGMAGLPRTGTVIAAGQHGEPPYLIRWTAGDYDSWFTPGVGARVEKHP